jgi:hypothetical protein
MCRGSAARRCGITSRAGTGAVEALAGAGAVEALAGAAGALEQRRLGGHGPEVKEGRQL